MKKIVFIFRELGVGGAQKIQMFIANTAIKYGYEVEIITMSSKKCYLDIDERIKIHTIDYDKLVLNEKNKLKKIVNKIFYLRLMRKKCLEINPNLICVFLIDIVRLVTISLTGLKFKIIGSERGSPSIYSKKKIKKYNKAIKKCDALVIQFEGQAQYYQIKNKHKIKVIYNPTINRNELQKNQRNECKEKFIFGAGRLSRQKRFDILIRAYAIVNKKYPEYKLKIYGDGEEKNNLIKIVEKLGIQKSVSFMGDVKNIFQDVNGNSIFVLTSDFEGLPNVITEALLNSIPCISTDCSPGGAKFLLNNGKCGEIVEKEDYEGVAEKIIKYIENPKIVKEYISQGEKHIKRFEADQIGEEWMKLFDEVIENE